LADSDWSDEGLTATWGAARLGVGLLIPGWRVRLVLQFLTGAFCCDPFLRVFSAVAALLYSTLLNCCQMRRIDDYEQVDRSYGRSASLLGVSVGGGNLRRTPGYCFPWQLNANRMPGFAFARTLSHAQVGVPLNDAGCRCRSERCPSQRCLSQQCRSHCDVHPPLPCSRISSRWGRAGRDIDTASGLNLP